ncbi:glycosyltransferase family 2 protein [Luteolibacter sp. AS25]|uniref:glycosyltransferase family 2 protein n=1 Tax=Luteolibacter sp. AS25 TaxID=3135776 RepID=UPI00398A6DC2
MKSPSPHLIIPVYNRRSVTCRCLRMISPLLKNGWKIVVVDDGSTDGTRDAIENDFPDVKTLSGTGSLYWTGAMELGMRWAYDNGANCMVWLNDDVTLEPVVIENIAAKAMKQNCVISGLGCILDNKGDITSYHRLTYRGLGKLDQQIISEPPLDLIAVDACRGNLVAFPRDIVSRIGFPDGSKVPHMMGDSDYTLRATKAGFNCFIDPDSPFIEEYVYREDNDSWLLDSRTPLKIIRQTLSKRGGLYPRSFLIFSYRHWKMQGIANCLKSYSRLIIILTIKLITPRSLIERIFAKKHVLNTSERTAPSSEIQNLDGNSR